MPLAADLERRHTTSLTFLLNLKFTNSATHLLIKIKELFFALEVAESDGELETLLAAVDGIFAGIGGEIKRPLSGRLSGHEPAYFRPRLSSRILGVTSSFDMLMKSAGKTSL